MKTFKAALLGMTVLAAFATNAVEAQTNMGDMKMDAPKTNASSMTDGEVKGVDKAHSKVTLAHGDIKNVGMPGMTMEYAVADPKSLGSLKAGDKVKFAMEKVNGVYTVTKIAPAK